MLELEKTLARLEQAEAAKCFASGMGAISATLFALLGSGDHVLFLGDIYGPTIEFADRLAAYGVTHDQCFDTDIAGIEAAIKPATRVIYLESPGSMLFGLLPIRRICELARARGITTIIDNTVATPLLQKPLQMGCDLSIHSCTKYIGGHSDTLGGAVVGSAELIERIFYKGYMLLGAAMAPMDAWLLLRGLMTLPARLMQQQASALRIAHFLSDQPSVRRVYHPALETGEQSALFAEQMRGHSGLLSFDLAADSHADLLAQANRLKLFGKAISWGGVESLVTAAHRGEPAPDHAGRYPRGLLRLSIGLEGTDALIADLEQALTP